MREGDGEVPAAVVVAGLRRTYGCGPSAVEAVRDVSLRVAKGELVGIVGPSGRGNPLCRICWPGWTGRRRARGLVVALPHIYGKNGAG